MTHRSSGVPVAWRRALGTAKRLAWGSYARVLFGFSEGTMVLLHGFIKKTQKTPQHDRTLALNRLGALSESKRRRL